MTTRRREFNESLHSFHSGLLSVKARVTTLWTGLMISRSQMSGLDLACRLQWRISKLYSTRLSSISSLGDSLCMISVLKKNSTHFTPFMHSQVSEVVGLRDQLKEKVPIVEDLYHIASEHNAADICTRSDAKITDLTLNSDCQCGPVWIRELRHSWPCSRDFIPVPMPDQETKAPIRIVSPTVPAKPSSSMVSWVLGSVSHYTQAVLKLAKLCELATRLKFGVCGSLTSPPSLHQCVERAKSLLYEEEMHLTDSLLSKGRCKDLNVKTKDGV